MKSAIAFAIESEAKQHSAENEKPLRMVRVSAVWLVEDRGQSIDPDAAQPALIDELETIAICDEIAKGITAELPARALQLAASIRKRHAFAWWHHDVARRVREMMEAGEVLAAWDEADYMRQGRWEALETEYRGRVGGRRRAAERNPFAIMLRGHA